MDPLWSEWVLLIHSKFCFNFTVQDFNAKLTDFGLAKSGSVEDHTGLTASIAGAYGFLAPEYIATGKLPYLKAFEL